MARLKFHLTTHDIMTETIIRKPLHAIMLLSRLRCFADCADYYIRFKTNLLPETDRDRVKQHEPIKILTNTA